jgi:hypothetical protein
MVGVTYAGGDIDGPPGGTRYRRIDYAAPPAHGADSAKRRMAAEGKCCAAAATARVFREEIFPFIERAYRTSDDRGIFGHSLGGIFATYALFAEPDLFQRYAITTPSPWSDNASIFELEAEYARTHRALPKHVVITVGSEEFLTDRYTAERLSATLQARHYEGLDLWSSVLQGSQHNSLVEYSYALRVLYPPTSYTEISGNPAVKDSAHKTVDEFLDAYHRGNAAGIRGTLVTDTVFGAIVSDTVTTNVNEYVTKAAKAGLRGRRFTIDTLYAVSDAPKDAVFIAAYTERTGTRPDRHRVMTFEVVRRANGWRIAYMQDVAATPPKPLTVIQVQADGKPVRNAAVSINSAAGRVASGLTDDRGYVRLPFDWHADWTTPGYIEVTASGYKPTLAPPPNRDSVTVVLKS